MTHCKSRDGIPYDILLLTSHLPTLLKIISFYISNELSLTCDWVDLKIIHGTYAISTVLVQHSFHLM